MSGWRTDGAAKVVFQLVGMAIDCFTFRQWYRRAMKTKVCSKCSHEKPLVEFSKAKGYKYGVNSRCRSCIVLHVKDWRSKNPEKRRAWYREWRKNNLEKERDRSRKIQRERRFENPDKFRLANKKWEEKHPGRKRELARTSYRNSPEKNRAKCENRRARR